MNSELVTMGMMPSAGGGSEIYDSEGIVIGYAYELTEDDDMYHYCRQINIPRLCC